jgi:protein TonB
MFDETLWVAKGRTRKPWTVPASFAGQMVGVGLLVLAPLIFTEKLTLSRLTLPAPIRYGVSKAPSAHSVKLVSTGREPRRPGVFTAPAAIPRTVAKLVDAPEIAENAGPEAGCAYPCLVGDPNALPLGVIATSAPATALPPAPPVKRVEPKPAARPAAEPIRIKVSSGVQEARLIDRTKPAYPRLAVIARISGTVELAAVIGTDGRVREINVLGGHPMLVPAAIEAVRQWVYQPTMLNGEPVEVSTWITVRFILGAS